MLAKEYCLKKDQDIKTVFKKGKGFYSRSLGVKLLSNNLANNRFCFVVSNKISKKATKRNKLKRQLREIIRLNLAKIKGNFDIVVVARAKGDVLGKDYQELEQEILFIFKKLRLLK